MTPALAKAFTDLLKAAAPVTAICGSRIFPDTAPDRVTHPYIVYSELSTNPEDSHDDCNGLDASEIQFACYAPDTLTATTLRQAVRAALTAPGALPGVVVTQPQSRTISADELSLANAILEVTFMHRPTNTL